MQDFVHLHLHTEYSLLDGACRIKPLFQHLKDIGQTAVAITDHGVMFGVIDFYKEAKKQGIKPIIGCEVYVAPRTRHDKVHKTDSSPSHLVLLCKNNTGYQNLIYLVSKAFTEGFYFKPRIDRQLLEGHTEGLIALSACLAGEIPRALMAGNYHKAKETAIYYRDLFGKDNYYIEIQDHGIPEQRQILSQLVTLAEEIDVGLVATNDCHYNQKQDSKMQNLLVCIQTNHTVDEPGDLEFPTDEFYVKSAHEMAEIFPNLPEALSNTQKIADRCEVEFEFGNTKLPVYTAPDGRENQEYFRDLCYQGLARHYGAKPDDTIKQRLEYELAVIEKMGYVDYFLIVYDFIAYAKSKGIAVGPGRGSGAGSIAAYCVGITGVDPIKYSLLFERFLNPERISMPDFDIDFCYERRQEVIDYVIEKYGEEHVAQIITFGTMAARGAIRDVGRAMGVNYQGVDQVAKLIPMEPNMTIKKALASSSELRALCEADSMIQELIDTAQKVEGMPRHASTHAAGVVITRDRVIDYVPVQKTDQSIVTQFTMTTLEELGLLKMDFLGLRTLTVIADAQRMIQTQNPQFTIETIPLIDAPTFAMLGSGHAEGVFQFESAGMRQVLSQLSPESVEDLIAVISLYRPGPMESIPKYIENRHNPKKVTYKHPLLQPVLDVTYGCIVYQEQVMQICRQMAGYSYGRADLVRRAMSKKKVDVMEKERTNFINGITNPDGTIECCGAVANGVSAQIANEIFDEMSSFASYAFNKSHAAAYALVAYQTAYLKCHYPREYMAALLTSVLDNTDKVIGYINECDRMGIKVLPADVNQSEEGFTVDGQYIRFGLLAVKNLGRGVIRELIIERKNGKFTTFSNLCHRMYGKDLNKRGFESLIKCGALDTLGLNRRQMLTHYIQIIDDIDQTQKNNLSGQFSLFSQNEDLGQEYQVPPLQEMPLQQLLAMEKEVTGMFISGHPMSQYEIIYKKTNAVKINTLTDRRDAGGDGKSTQVAAIVASKKLKTVRSGQMMAFVMLEDTTGTVEMLVFANTLERCSAFLQPGNAVLVKARLSAKDEEEPKLVCEAVSMLEEALAGTSRQGEKPKGLYIKVDGNQSAQFEEAKEALELFPGKTPVMVYFADENRLAKAPRNLWVDYNPTLHTMLAELLSAKNVTFLQ